jgi:nucleoside-diphosphate-sugar epimerase
MTVLAYRFHWIANPDEYAARAIEVRDRPEQGAHELWGYVDVRDAAYACRLGLESEGLGFEVLNITSADSLSDVPTEELMRRFCPDVQRRERIEGTNSAWSTEKAQRLLGYAPRRSWRDE